MKCLLNASYVSIFSTLSPAVPRLLVTAFGYAVPFWVAGTLTVVVAAFALTLKNLDQLAYSLIYRL